VLPVDEPVNASVFTVIVIAGIGATLLGPLAVLPSAPAAAHSARVAQPLCVRGRTDRPVIMLAPS
jgi:hypothetical protein